MEMAATAQTLKQWRINLGWSPTRLAHEAGLAVGTAFSAERGEPIKPETAKAIADAFTRAYGYQVQVTDIIDLNIL